MASDDVSGCNEGLHCNHSQSCASLENEESVLDLAPNQIHNDDDQNQAKEATEGFNSSSDLCQYDVSMKHHGTIC